MPDPLLPTTAQPEPGDKPRRNDAGAALLKWVTILSLVGSLLVGLSFLVCFRYDQRAITYPDGSVVWHEEGLHGGGWFVSDTTLKGTEPPAASPIIDWVGFKGREGMPWPRFSTRTETTSGTPLVLMPVLLLVITAGFWTQRYFVDRRNRKRADRCRECGYEKAGLSLLTCPECGAPWSAADPTLQPSIAQIASRRAASNAALTLACASLAIWFFWAACELSFRVWINWAIIWPVLIVLGLPAFAVAALARPRTVALLSLAAAVAWLMFEHVDAYAYLLVHWVRSPGVPGSKGFEADTIKWIFRFVGAVPLFVTAVLTAYSAPRRASSTAAAQSAASA